MSRPTNARPASTATPLPDNDHHARTGASLFAIVIATVVGLVAGVCVFLFVALLLLHLLRAATHGHLDTLVQDTVIGLCGLLGLALGAEIARIVLDRIVARSHDPAPEVASAGNTGVIISLEAARRKRSLSGGVVAQSKAERPVRKQKKQKKTDRPVVRWDRVELPDGRIIMGVLVNGKARFITGKSQDEIEEAWARGVLSMVLAGVWPIKPLVGRTLQDHVQVYLSEQSAHLDSKSPSVAPSRREVSYSSAASGRG